jgi:hypothetical protein
MIQPRYRRDYTGEFVIFNTNFRDGIKIQTREWVDNPIVNQHISGRAAVIMSDAGRDRFNYSQLQHHRGGLRGSKRLQTYGCGTVWQHLPLNFYVTTDDLILSMIDRQSYSANTVIYTDRTHVLEFPKKFFLVPYCPLLSDPALALYLAAFDGHKEIFVLGHDISDGMYPREWHRHVEQVIDCYQDCKFYFIGRALNEHCQSWRRFPNVELITLRKFVTSCDV